MPQTPDETLSVERRLGDWMRARLPYSAAEFLMFVFKQGWACLFGITLLCAIIGTKIIWNPDWTLQRYDALFMIAIGLQIGFLFSALKALKKPK